MKHPAQKLLIYETIHTLNQGFEHVLSDLARLEKLGFRGESFEIFRVIVEETRARANSELVEVMNDREQTDWARFGRLRRQREQKYEDPNDILIKAEQVKRARQQSTRKRRPLKAVE